MRGIYGDWDPAFVWKDEKHFPVLHLDRERALQAWKVTLDREYLILSDDYVWEEDGKLHIEGGKETVIRCYPKLKDFRFFRMVSKRVVWNHELPCIGEEKKDGGYQVTVTEGTVGEDSRNLQPENKLHRKPGEIRYSLWTSAETK